MASANRLAGPFAHIVGDRAQARHGFTESWQERLERISLDRITRSPLSINYRTPWEVMTSTVVVVVVEGRAASVRRPPAAGAPCVLALPDPVRTLEPTGHRGPVRPPPRCRSQSAAEPAGAVLVLIRARQPTGHSRSSRPARNLHLTSALHSPRSRAFPIELPAAASLNVYCVH